MRLWRSAAHSNRPRRVRRKKIGAMRIRVRLMFRYAPDSGAKANIAGLPRWARSGRYPRERTISKFNTG
jgi:hypothetical protein